MGGCFAADHMGGFWVLSIQFFLTPYECMMRLSLIVHAISCTLFPHNFMYDRRLSRWGPDPDSGD